MRNIFFPLLALAASWVGVANVPAAICDVRLKGPVGERLEACIRRHVMETDVTYITDCFDDRTETRNWWQTEFWGKYMRSADVGEVLREHLPANPAFTLVRSESPDVWIACSATLPFGGHSENPDGANPATVTFVDYASAGNDWTPANQVRTWFATEWTIPGGW